MKLSPSGVEAFPRLLPDSYQREFVPEAVPSGVPELDELLHGGLERGTISIISGPTGVGKTTLGLQFMKEAAGRGKRSVVCTFEERIDTLLVAPKPCISRSCHGRTRHSVGGASGAAAVDPLTRVRSPGPPGGGGACDAHCHAR